VRALCLTIAVALSILALVLATTGCERASEGTATAELHADASAVGSCPGDDCGSELAACQGCPSIRGKESSDDGEPTSVCARATGDGEPTTACGDATTACAKASGACERTTAEDECPSGCVRHDDGKCPSDCVLHEDGKCPPDCVHHKDGDCRQDCEAHATTQ
jgi:hypothetical protein